MRHDGEEEGVRPWKTVRMETWLNEVKSVAESILNRFELSVHEHADALSLFDDDFDRNDDPEFLNVRLTMPSCCLQE